MESKPFWGNNEAITTAKLTITGSGDDFEISLGLSDTYDGTYTYEAVSGFDASQGTNSLSHTFTATGKWIKWKAVGLNYTVTKLEITPNT